MNRRHDDFDDRKADVNEAINCLLASLLAFGMGLLVGLAWLS